MNRLNKIEPAILDSLMCPLHPEDLHSELVSAKKPIPNKIEKDFLTMFVFPG